MKRIPKIVAFLLLAAALPRPGTLCAQTPPARDREAVLRAEVEFLCDSLSAGRGLGTPGAQSGTFYLLRQLRNAGLRTTVQSFTAAGRTGHNIVAVTPGWYRRYIIVGAHFDALGTLGGRIYPGADANASGVAALLQLAKMFTRLKECGKNYTHTLVFVALDAKESDLAGASALYSRISQEKLGFSAEDVSMVVNLDQLGCTLSPLTKGNPDYLMMLSDAATGRRESLLAAEQSAHTGLELAFDYYGSKDFTNLFFRRISDQRIFLEHGIPAVMFTSGITMLNNKPGDTPDTLDYQVLAKRVRLIFHYLDRIL